MRSFVTIIAFISLLSSQACAKTFSFATPAGSANAGFPLTASAKFNVTAGSMVVTLVNLQANTVDIAQNISSLLFTVSNGAAVLSLAPADLAGSSGTQVTIGTGGVVSGVQAVSPITHWSAGSSAGQSYLSDLVSGGNPVHTIIGPASTGGNYGSVDATIAGNATNNPFIQNQAIFTINNPGILSTSSISNVSIGFGTTAASSVRAVPEPGTIFLVSIGLLAAISRTRRIG